jgi:hypothetical protein
LQREFAHQAAEQNLDSTGRVAWLLDRLENYVQRWLGMRATAADDLFLMIEAGAAAVSRELRSGDFRKIDERWQAFLVVLDATRQGKVGEPGKLAEFLAAVRVQLAS